MNTALIPKKDSKTELCIAIGLFILAQSFTLYRLFFGVNFFDEPFYIAVPFRFLLNQKLFIHDLGLAQTFALVLYPFVKTHNSLFQSSDTIILWMRFCFFILYFGLSLILIFLYRRLFSLSLLLTVFSCFGLFLPGDLPTLSYNTCGTLFLTAGLFLLFYGWYYEQNLFLVFSGLSMGTAVLSYISLVMLLPITFVTLIIFFKNSKQRLLFGGSTGIVLLYPFALAVIRWSSFKNILEVSQQFSHSSNPILQGLHGIHRLFPKQVILFVLIYLFFLFFKGRKDTRIRQFCFLLLPAVAAILAYLSTLNWPVFAIYLTILGLTTLGFIPRERSYKGLFWLIYVPSLLAGIIVSSSSAIGIINAQVGLVPAVLVSLLFLGSIIDVRKRMSTSIKLFALATPILLSLFSPIRIWDESINSDLTARVDEGPFRGIYTSPEKKTYLKNVTHALLAHSNSNDTLMIHPNFPAGYLIAGVSPAAGLLWYGWSNTDIDEYLAQAYEKYQGKNSRILWMKEWWAHPKMKTKNTLDPKSPISRMIFDKHYALTDNEWFTLFAPRE